ncbi:DUF6907 domain-containing protein [Nocardia sp. NPDC052316]|uniref:DUF6907 domain-containing protein n=1 Tax=Nocardia sp. NPDC052316 TaxID=3364329 RepID=UPI0037C62166
MTRFELMLAPMSDAPAEEGRQCPSWCDEHFDHPDTEFPEDDFQVHTGLKSTQVLSNFGLQPLTTQLSRTDSREGAVESYSIELCLHGKDGDIWIELTPAEATHLARQLDAFNSEVRRVPTSAQEEIPNPE